MTAALQATGLVALADRIELWPIDRLRPYERNPRTHSEAQVDQIAASMVEFGWTNPILIDENAGILVEAVCSIERYGTMVKSPNGYPMQSPYVAVANKQVEIMVRIAAEFGMTPSSRSRIRAGGPAPEDPFEQFLERGRG